jgi:hypothetical protein
MALKSEAEAHCAIHKFHAPVPHVIHTHHVLPQSWGGDTVPANLIDLCPTGHYNVHHLIDAYIRSAGDPGWDVTRHYGLAERVLARKAWDQRPSERPPFTVAF